MADESSRKRLGRGLAALIGDIEPDSGTLRSEQRGGRPTRTAAIEALQPNPGNPRRRFAEEDLDELAASIRRHGVVQPILVRPLAGGGREGAQWEIVAGERRWRAAQRAGLHEVPVHVREIEDRQALEIAIIENVQRADLDPLEEAAGYQRLIDEHGYSQAELGDTIGKSRSHVANTLRLLKLPNGTRAHVEAGRLSAGHARALLTADEPDALAERVVREGLSVRQTEALAADTPRNAERPQPRQQPERSADLDALEQRLARALGLSVTLSWTPARRGGEGRGELRLRMTRLEQLDDVVERLERSSR